MAAGTTFGFLRGAAGRSCVVTGAESGIGRATAKRFAVAFLASDEASFNTGVVLPVDGGYLAQ